MSDMIAGFKVKLTDGSDEVKIWADVTWLEGGDNKIKLKGYVGVEEGNILDKWESTKTTINFSIEPVCVDVHGNEKECPKEIEDYYSQEGKGTVSWVCNPLGDSEVYVEVREGGAD